VRWNGFATVSVRVVKCDDNSIVCLKSGRNPRHPLAKTRLALQERASGEMAEWLKAHAWKACVRETVPWVRIPLSPPAHLTENDPRGSRTSKIPLFFAKFSIGELSKLAREPSGRAGECIFLQILCTSCDDVSADFAVLPTVLIFPVSNLSCSTKMGKSVTDEFDTCLPSHPVLQFATVYNCAAQARKPGLFSHSSVSRLPVSVTRG
jgi:hypothetical protein